MIREIRDYIAGDISSALQSLKNAGSLRLDVFPDVYLERPKHDSHGDLSCNVALRLAKPERKSPMAIAEDLARTLETSAPEDAPYSAVTVAKPGFINFVLDRGIVHGFLRDVLVAGTRYGRSDIGKGKSVNVEFVSANPTGPLTVGHGRHAVTGDVVANVLENCGYEVTREYYFNNAGNQMNVLGESVRLRYLELLGKKVEFPESHYQGDYIRDIARQLHDEHGAALRDADGAPFKARAEKVVFADIESSLAKVGVVFGKFFNEYSLYEDGTIENAVRELRKLGYAYDKDGAVWFRTTKFGLPEDKVIVKSTGEPTYRLPDICYHINKINRGYDLIVDIFGQDHHATVPEVQAGIKALGFPVDNIRVMLLQFVTLTRKGQAVKMSTRKANYVTLDEMIDTIAAEMRQRLSRDYPDIEERTADEDFVRMARDAVRYFYIMRKTSAHLDFDLDLAASQSMENPVYYIQYAHARICSIFRKYRDDTGGKEMDFKADQDDEISLLIEEKELKIAKMLARYPEIVEDIGCTLETHKLHEYLTELASELQQYYTVHRVLNPDNPRLTEARLSLIHSVRIVLRNALGLLGVSCPERM